MEIVASIDKITDSIRDDVASLQRQSRLFELIALFILVAFILANFIFMLRSVVQPILQLHEGAETIGRGDMDYRVQITGPGEIRELSRAFNEMSANLKTLTDSLQKSETDLRHLTSQLITAQEQERKRIAMELHEGLGQCLMTLKIQLRLIQNRWPTESIELKEDFDHAHDYLADMVEEIRRICQNLSPVILENLGLNAAIEHLLNEFGKFQKLAINVDIDDIQNLFSPEIEINIFRIFQESLNNIARHAQATQVWVTVKKQADRVYFLIKDNGIGFDPEQSTHKDRAGKGMGLAAIEERLRMIGAHRNIVSQAGTGTGISFSIPMQASG